MRRFVAAAILVAALGACGPADRREAESDVAVGGYAVSEEAAAPQDAQQRPAPAMPAPAPAPPPPAQAGAEIEAGQPSQPAGPAPVLYLAYSYAMSLELPSQRVAAAMDAHVQACQAAGPRLCQLMGSHRTGDPNDRMSGYVQLRGEPAWLRAFMASVAAQVEEADGRIVAQTTQSEDLTRQITDTEARLEAQIALRDRLQQLLRSRPGRLADLLEVERELARVQGEIDAVQSILAVMRTRVAMSELTINYASAPRPVGSDTFRPLRDAFANFLGIVVAGFAAIVTVIAGLIPVAVIVVPLIWLALRWRRRRGGAFFRRRGQAPPPPAT